MLTESLYCLLFSNSAEYLNYLLTSDLGFHMLHFDILIGWVPVLIFVQTGWIVCFGGFKTANGNCFIPIQASLFFTSNVIRQMLLLLGSIYIKCYIRIKWNNKTHFTHQSSFHKVFWLNFVNGKWSLRNANLQHPVLKNRGVVTIKTSLALFIEHQLSHWA